MSIIDILFSNYKWYRKLIGGTWLNLIDCPHNTLCVDTYWTKKLWMNMSKSIILDMENINDKHRKT